MKISSMPTTRQFNLESDPDGAAWVEFRQGKFGETKRRGEIQSRTRFIRKDKGGETAVEQEINNYEVMALDIYLTLCGAGGFTDEAGENLELFTFKERNGIPSLSMGEDAFMKALDKLPEEVVREMHRHCLTVNKQWDPYAEGE